MKYILNLKLSKVILLTFLIFLCHCKNDKQLEQAKQVEQVIQNNAKTIVIPDFNDLKSSAIKSSGLIEETTIVKLETKRESLISRPAKVKVLGERIFVLDSKNGLLEFNIEGKFIQQIGSIGKGPGQYLNAGAFDIDENKQEIIVQDRRTLKIFIYTLEGVFKSSKKADFFANSFVIDKLTGNLVFDTYLKKQRKLNNSTPSVIISNKKGEVLNTMLDTDPAVTMGYKSLYNLFANDTIVLFNQPFDNTIYKISKGEVGPFLNFKFKGKAIPSGANQNIDFRAFKDKLKKEGYSYFTNNSGYFLVGNSLLFSAVVNGKRENLLYDIKKDEVKLIVNDKKTSSFVGFLGAKIDAYGTTIVNYAQTDWFLNKEYYKSEAFKGSRMEEVMQQTKEGDNPILIFNKLKQ